LVSLDVLEKLKSCTIYICPDGKRKDHIWGTIARQRQVRDTDSEVGAGLRAGDVLRNERPREIA